MFTTPDLSKEFHPVPKPAPRVKATPKPLGAGKKSIAWENDRSELKKTFEGWGIFSCELQVDGVCVKSNFLSFAHVERRRNLKPEEVKDPTMVALACQPCHHTVDFLMSREEGKKYVVDKIAERMKRLKKRKKIWRAGL